jgi:hypothetical protein
MIFPTLAGNNQTVDITLQEQAMALQVELTP